MMLDQVDKKDGKKLVSTMDEVMKLLEYLGLAWSQRIRPQQVGVEPSNRDGVGVNAEDVHSLGADIFVMGVVLESGGFGCVRGGSPGRVHHLQLQPEAGSQLRHPAL